jgi:hypothetical protein
MKEQSVLESWCVENFSDPTKHFNLPFPAIDPQDSKRRYYLDSSDKFHFMGRTVFKQLYDNLLLQDSERLTVTTRYSGSEGYGRSLMLSGLVDLLLVKGLRVVYLSDCQYFSLNDPIGQLRRALYFTFHDRPQRQAQVFALKTYEDISHFCTEYGRKFIFIFDHYGNDSGEEEKLKLRRWLSAISWGHRRVFCYAPNDMTFRTDKAVTETAEFVTFTGGFDEVFTCTCNNVVIRGLLVLTSCRKKRRAGGNMKVRPLRKLKN